MNIEIDVNETIDVFSILSCLKIAVSPAYIDDIKELNLTIECVREIFIPNRYLLRSETINFFTSRVQDAVEAVRSGRSLSGVIEQAENYISKIENSVICAKNNADAIARRKERFAKKKKVVDRFAVTQELN